MDQPKIRVSVGVLAYNESKSIAMTVGSILSQKMQGLDNGALTAELVVVPNGCTDTTAEVAQVELDKLASTAVASGFHTTKVCPLAEGGKHKAWNSFVHDISDSTSEYLVLIDADVTLEHDRCIYNLVSRLSQSPQCEASIPRYIKNIEQKKSRNITDRISLGVSSMRKGTRGALGGWMYCIRSDFARSISLPSVLMGEDAFIRAMLVTRQFTHKDDPSRIAEVEDAGAISDVYTSLSEIIRNKTRRNIELSINSILYSKLWKESTLECPAGLVLKKNDQDDISWSHKLVNEEFRSRGFWAVPPKFIYSQFLQLKHQSLRKKVILFLPATCTIALNLVTVFRANKLIAAGKTGHLWDKESATELQ